MRFKIRKNGKSETLDLEEKDLDQLYKYQNDDVTHAKSFKRVQFKGKSIIVPGVIEYSKKGSTAQITSKDDFGNKKGLIYTNGILKKQIIYWGDGKIKEEKEFIGTNLFKEIDFRDASNKRIYYYNKDNNYIAVIVINKSSNYFEHTIDLVKDIFDNKPLESIIKQNKIYSFDFCEQAVKDIKKMEYLA